MLNKRQKLQKTLYRFYQRPVARVSLELFLSIGTVLFFAIFAIRPTLLTMSDLIKEIDDKKQLNNQLQQKIAALNSVQTIYLQLKDRLFVVDQAIPSQPRFEEVLKIIEKVASENKVVITNIQVKEIPRTDEDNVDFLQKQRLSVPVNVTVLGDYQSIRDFTIGIAEMRRALIIDSIVFNVNEEKGQKQLRASITINMQYFGKKYGRSK